MMKTSLTTTLLLTLLLATGCRQSTNEDTKLTGDPGSLVGMYTLGQVNCNEGTSTYWSRLANLQIEKSVEIGKTVDKVLDRSNGCLITTTSTFEPLESFRYSSRILNRTCLGACNAQQLEECRLPVGETFTLIVSKSGNVMTISDESNDESFCQAGNQTGSPISRYYLRSN